METYESHTKPSISHEVWLTFLKILVVVFACETVAVAVLRLLTIDGLWAIALDHLLLAGLSTPLLYRLIVSPIRNALEQCRQVETALRESEERFSKVFHSSPMPIAITTLEEGRIVDVNDSLLRGANCTREEMVGHTTDELRVWEDPGDRTGLVRMLKEGAAPIRNLPVRFRLRSGEIRLYENSMELIELECGTCILTMLNDVTERKRMEQALQETRDDFEQRAKERTSELRKANQKLGREIEEHQRTEQQLLLVSSAVAQSTDGLGVVDLEGNLLFLNEAFAAMHGYTPGELLGKRLSVFHTPAQMPAVEAANRQLQETGRFSGEIWHTCRDGPVFPTWMSNALFYDEDGNPAGIIGTAHDITERKQAEEALKRNERLLAESERPAATGRMAARIAHEINNPLAGIANSFRLVKRAVPEDHRHYKFAEVIEREIDRIGRIVRQMFDLYRPGQETIEDIAVGTTIKEVVAMLEPSCRQHEVRVEIDVDPPGASVRAPEGSVRQVLYNLIENAIEASPPGTMVKITGRIVEDEEGDAVQIAVADQGAGVPKEARKHIFEPFFTTKSGDRSRGVGLGLSVSKGIVDSLGGFLGLESFPGKGTTFRVILPFATGKRGA